MCGRHCGISDNATAHNANIPYGHWFIFTGNKKSSDSNLHTHSQLIFDKDAKRCAKEMIFFSINGVGKMKCVCRKTQLDIYLSHTKINFRWDKDLNVKTRNYKVARRKYRENA